MPTKEGKVGLSGDAWVAWGNETVYGTVNAFASGDNGSLFLNESLTDVLNLRTPPNISSAFTDVAQVYTATEIISGDLQIPVTYEDQEDLDLHSFGVVSDAGGESGTFDRVFDLTSKGRYANTGTGGKSMSIHVNRGVVGSGVTDPTIWSYTGMVVDQVVFACDRDGALTKTITFFGKTVTLATSSDDPTFSTAPIPNSTECVAKWGGVEIPLTRFSITMRRLIDRDRFFLGGTQTAEPPMAQYEVIFEGETEWDNENRVSSTTLRADRDAGTARTLLLTFTSTAVISGTSQKYIYELEINQGIINSFPVNVGAVGRIKVPLGIKAYDSVLTSIPHELRLNQTGDNTYATT